MSSSDVIFLLDSTDRLERIPYTPYSSEDLLQQLIEKHPDVLSGEQIDPTDPPRWLLVSREAGVPDGEGSPLRWAVDHLLLDQNAVPTFVEVKRSTDTRIRREVVGQMLDYAANASHYWPVDLIRALASQQSGGIENLDREVANLLACSEDDADRLEAYWKEVEENLRRGRLRLLFVADEIPRELRRVIEFLNEHLRTIEVLGVEVRQYSQGTLRALVPRVIGQTERAREEHGSRTRLAKTTEADFLRACPPWSHELFRTVLAQAQERNLIVSWGTRGFSVRATTPKGLCSMLYGYPSEASGYPTPSLEVYLKDLDSLIDVPAFRSALADTPFEARGNFTMRAVLTEESVQELAASLPPIWKAYEDVQQATA